MQKYKVKSKNSLSIFFDFDGVIADSLHIAFEVNKLSKPTLTLERYQDAFNGNINNAKFEDEVVYEVDFMKEYDARFVTLGIDNEKKNYIQKLSKEFRLFIISSSHSSTIREYLTRHGILECFTDILGNENETSKVKKFNLLFNTYAIDPVNVIFITDSAGDIKEAKEVKIKHIVGILGGYQNEASLKKGEPTIIIRDFSQFYDFVSLVKSSHKL